MGGNTSSVTNFKRYTCKKIDICLEIILKSTSNVISIYFQKNQSKIWNSKPLTWDQQICKLIQLKTFLLEVLRYWDLGTTDRSRHIINATEVGAPNTFMLCWMQISETSKIRYEDRAMACKLLTILLFF